MRVAVLLTNRIIAEGVAEIVRQSGWDVSGVATTAADAERRMLGERTQLAIIGLDLQDGRGSGGELALRWRTANPAMGMVMVAPDRKVATIQRALAAGGQAVLCLPFRAAAVRASIEQVSAALMTTA